ncbi:MAG: hypothetical protein NTX00_00550 [Candidatus Parcubacteria bacterium]|nr:hypothetical protein [Candidatus Parcubacteria bacterium]
MKKSYLLLAIALTLLLGAVVSCNTTQAEYDPYIIKDLSTLKRNDFVQLKDGRLMAVHDIWCEKNNPTRCELNLRQGYELNHEPFRMRLEYWAPLVEKITRYGDPTWTILAKKYLDNQ